MGAGASIPDEINEETARSLAGDKYDQAKFDELAVDGKISKNRWIEAEARTTEHPNQGGAGLRRFRRASIVVVVVNRFNAPIKKKQKAVKRGKGLKWVKELERTDSRKALKGMYKKQLGKQKTRRKSSLAAGQMSAALAAAASAQDEASKEEAAKNLAAAEERAKQAESEAQAADDALEIDVQKFKRKASLRKASLTGSLSGSLAGTATALKSEGSIEMKSEGSADATIEDS
jgi:hypothetical protein